MEFPLYEDRFPLQLLSFLRLARIQDSAQLANVDMGTDKSVSEMNEYEVLMLLLSETNQKLTAFPDPSIDSEIKVFKAYSESKNLTLTEVVFNALIIRLQED